MIAGQLLLRLTVKCASFQDQSPPPLLKEQDTAVAITEYLHSSVKKYDASMDEGIRQAEADVAAVVGECPSAKIVMAGYSQGAIAVHDAENWLVKNRPGQFSHIAGTLLLGDPDRVPNTKAKLFGDTSAKNATGLRVYFHLVKAHDVPDPATTANIANADDIIGDFKLGDLTNSKTRTHAMSVHTSYAHLVKKLRKKKKMVYEPVLATAANWIAGLLLKSSTAVEAPLPAMPRQMRLSGFMERHAQPPPTALPPAAYRPVRKRRRPAADPNEWLVDGEGSASTLEWLQ